MKQRPLEPGTVVLGRSNGCAILRDEVHYLLDHGRMTQDTTVAKAPGFVQFTVPGIRDRRPLGERHRSIVPVVHDEERDRSRGRHPTHVEL
jgi:hypothetical protein